MRPDELVRGQDPAAQEERREEDEIEDEEGREPETLLYRFLATMTRK
jgi:hypothetical protein